jgi:hypothetical protein
MALRSGNDLRPPPAPGRGAAWHAGGAVVAEVSCLCTTPCIGIRDPQRRALPFIYMRAALIADNHSLSRHRSPSRNPALRRES